MSQHYVGQRVQRRGRHGTVVGVAGAAANGVEVLHVRWDGTRWAVTVSAGQVRPLRGGR